MFCLKETCLLSRKRVVKKNEGNYIFMNKSEMFKVLKSIATELTSITKLHIINYLSKTDASNQEIFEKLKDKIEIKYRSSIFPALDSLHKNGLVKKYYDTENKKINYSLTCKKIVFDLVNFNVEIIKK